MFNPTKVKQETDGQLIRMGATLPEDAVGLAYLHAPPLDPKENVHITDLSGFTLENIDGRGTSDEDLWPNDQGLLTAWDGSPQLQAKSFILTNEFKDGEPLYYAHDLTYPAMSRGDAKQAAASILVQDHLGQPLPAERKYKAVATRGEAANQYKVRIFTSFQVQPNEDLRVIYTAFKDGRVIPGYAERLTPALAFTRNRNLEDVILIPNRNLHYYQAEGKEVGESQIYVGSLPIRESDHRQPIPFRYRLKARSAKGDRDYIVTTPWVYESVYHPDALSAADVNYQNGHKRLHNKVAIDLIAEFGDVEPFLDPTAQVEFTVESSSEAVHTYTQADGKNFILAYTEEPTQRILLPDDHRIQNRSMRVPFQVAISVDGEKPQLLSDSISILDGHRLIAGPFEGEQIDVALTRPYDPVNIYVKDNALYAYTNETDVFYVPRFSMRTESDSQIRVIEPAATSAEENWYVRVRNGQFRRMSTDDGFHIDQYYSIPEYFRQGFDEQEGIPFRKILGETARVIGDQRVRLRHKPLHLKKELVSNRYNIEVSVNGLPAEVLGWDAAEGTLDLDTHVKATDDVVVSYYYEEHAFEYRGFYNEDTGTFWHLDLNPGKGHYFTDHNQETDEVHESETFSLINRTVYLYMRPTAMFTEEKEMVRGSYRENALFHSFHELQESGLILLAKIQVRPNSSIENLTLVDIRKRGGGLKETVSKERFLKEEPGARHYWDIANWDGEPYPENGVVVVRLPSYILEDKGGRFTKAEVEAAVQKHIAFGVLPVIEYVEEPKEILQKPKAPEVDLKREGGGV